MLHDSPVIVQTAVEVAIVSPVTGLDPNAVPEVETVLAAKVFDVFVCAEDPGPLWD